MDSSRRLPMILIAGGAALVLIVLAFILLKPGQSGTTATDTVVVKIEPTVEAAPTPQESPVVRTGPGSDRGAAVLGTSVRDPFMPLATPSADSGTTSTGTKKATSSNPSSKPGKATESTKKASEPTRNPSGDSTTKSGDKSGSTKSKDSGPKAPQPIGAAKPDGEQSSQIEVRVIEVQDTLAVARINGSRTTLYQNVPDPSGVTYVSSLGGGCGWFGMGDLTERITICEGDSRQL